MPAPPPPSQPLVTRRILGFSAAAAVSCVAAPFVAGRWGLQSAPFMIAMLVANTLACSASGWLLAGVRTRHPAAQGRWVLAWLGAGLLLMGVLIAWTVAWRGQGGDAPPALWLALAPVVNAFAVVGVFFGAGDLLALATRNVRTVRFRIIVFGLLCAGAAMGIQYVESWRGDWPLVNLAMVALMVWALARVSSHRLTERLSAVVLALRQVSAGRLEVTLDERGRDELAELGQAFNGMTAGLRERALLERAFGQYVAPAVLEAIRSQGSLHLAPQRREVSVLFADVRGFTALSEAHPPEEVVRVLEVYLERVVDVVGRHQGFLNKFIGDAVMVVFNAPLEQADHARRAVACGRELQEEVARLNRAGAFGIGREVEVGVGVNTGPAVAGTLGSSARAEYTVIGDAVNVASRLTSAAGPGEVLVGAGTALACGDASLEPLPPLTVKGKAQPLQVFRCGAARAA